MAQKEKKEEITVRAISRRGRGKNDARRLRSAGMVPLSIYGGEGEAISAAAPLKDLAAILRSASGYNTIFTLDVEGVGATEVMFRERVIDPIKSRLMHADLKRLVRGQLIDVTVPLHLTGEPVGVRESDGVLDQIEHELKVRCRPRDIPNSIDIDVSHLNVNDVLHVSDIPAQADIEITSSPETVLATVSIIREEPVEEPTAEEDAAEPEVIGKGKQEEE